MRFKKTSMLTDTSNIYGIILNFIITFILSLVISILLYYKLWPKYTAILHTISELSCIFIALSFFFVIWLTHDLNTSPNLVIGYGFLMVAVYDSLHTYFFPCLYLYPQGQYDLSTKFWLLGRLTEALVIFFSSTGLVKMNMHKWKCLIISLTISLSVSAILIAFPNTLPLLLTAQGFTKPKILSEYAIIIIFIVSLYFIRKKLSRKGMISYKYLYMFLFLTIPTELCFTLFKNITSFYAVLGHTLRILSHFFLFRGIFVSAVIFPYTTMEKGKQKLFDKKNELKEILNGLPLGIVTYEDGERVSFANKKLQELFECNSCDILGLTPDQVTRKFSSASKNITDGLKDNRKSVFNVIRDYTTLKGNEIKLSASVVEYKHGILVSLSDAKKEQELDDLKIQTRTILNSINNLVLMADKNYNIIMLNKAFIDCVEMKEEEILGMSLPDLGQKLHINYENSNEVNTCHTRKMRISFEADIITPNFNKKNLLVHSSPIIGLENKEIGHIVVCSDITELKNEQIKLLRQEKLALIGQMGSGIVHETKNHLASIKGYCQLLSMKVSDQGLLNYIERIENITSDVNKVVVDFLSMAKPNETTMDITSLNEILESMNYMIESPSFMKGVNVELELSASDADIRVDESQIKQVILNMTKNAIESMSDIENPRLKISARIDYNDNEAVLTISDNGIGISEENIYKLGTPFFTTKDTGTGLGLSTCYKIINDHGGKINVYSKPNEGTTFVISLPLYNVEY